MQFDVHTQHHSGTSPAAPRESPFGPNVKRQSLPSQPTRSCSACDARLGPASKFCWSCGVSVIRDARADVDPPSEPVLAPAPPPPPVAPLVKGRQGPRAVPADLDDDISPASSLDLDYLDSQLGLMAPGSKPEPLPKLHVRALERQLAVAREAHPDSAEAPRAPEGAALPFSTMAELDLLSHVRVIEWLLAGNLVVLVALLLKV